MTDEELKQLVVSNARKAQTLLDSITETRKERQKLREETANLQNWLDSILPTILRKLTAIENKVDRLLQQEQDDNLG